MGSTASRTREGTAGNAGGEATKNRANLVDYRSDRHHCCCDCSGRSSVNMRWREVRCGRTEERGASLFDGRRQEGGGKKKQRRSLRMAVAHSPRTERWFTSAPCWAHGAVHAAWLHRPLKHVPLAPCPGDLEWRVWRRALRGHSSNP